MSILDKIRNELNPKKVHSSIGLRSIQMAVAEIPKEIEKANVDYISWGDTNLYPLQLQDLQSGSPIHNSIIKTKTKMMSGDGFLINGAKTLEESEAKILSLPALQKAEFNHLFKNPNGTHELDELNDMLSYDFQTYGAFCYEIIFNNDFSKISGIKYVNVANIRAGKMEEGKVREYFYSRDWEKARQSNYKPVPIPAYYKGNKDSLNQLVYVKQGSLEYYGVPSYYGAMNWIFTDFQMGVFHRSNIENGMNPGLHFKFYKLPTDDNEEQAIIDGIKKQWQGAARTGKMVASFSDGKETAMEISPVETSNLDKQLLLLAELCDKKILSGHQLTTPLLAGISVSGQLGGNTELETGYQIFDGIAMASDRKILRRENQWWFDYNKVGVDIQINKFKPFGNV